MNVILGARGRFFKSLIKGSLPEATQALTFMGRLAPHSVTCRLSEVLLDTIRGDFLTAERNARALSSIVRGAPNLASLERHLTRFIDSLDHGLTTTSASPHLDQSRSGVMLATHEAPESRASP